MTIRRSEVPDSVVQGRFVRLFLLFMIVSTVMACDMASETAPVLSGRSRVKSGAVSIEAGKSLFHVQCALCHRTNSTEKTVGPGLKGILKRPNLPVSRRPATPENILRQMREPFRDMPSFPHLSDDDMNDIIAYLNTL